MADKQRLVAVIIGISFIKAVFEFAVKFEMRDRNPLGPGADTPLPRDIILVHGVRCLEAQEELFCFDNRFHWANNFWWKNQLRQMAQPHHAPRPRPCHAVNSSQANLHNEFLHYSISSCEHES